ncbi:MAG: CocE/NonD family hydrolase, partial [Pyrinomonas methylaliphatogenes]|nr:CocE/NonD family hydrolase [Pyrinomonas methylaliphatogenes]
MRSWRNALVAQILVLLALFSVHVTAQQQAASAASEVRASYEKSEYQIPMRDGVKLFTVVYSPRDKSKKYPILLNRTPYGVGPYGPDAYKTSLGPSPLFMKEGYIFVYQDVRGRYMSEGEFVNMRPHKEQKSGPTDTDESTDTYDTIDWLIKNVPNNNGRVGMWGISYPGFYVAVGMIDAHPALKAASPQAPIADWFIGDDFHHNGAFFLPHAFNFLATFGRPRPRPTTETPPRFQHGTPDGYKFFLELGPLQNADRKYFKGDVAFWNEMMEHPNYDDFWKARNTLPHLKNIRPAVMTVGGWFDAEDLYGALNTYKATEKQSPGAYNILVMGPWYHGGWARSDGD